MVFAHIEHSLLRPNFPPPHRDLHFHSLPSGLRTFMQTNTQHIMLNQLPTFIIFSLKDMCYFLSSSLSLRYDSIRVYESPSIFPSLPPSPSSVFSSRQYKNDNHELFSQNNIRIFNNETSAERLLVYTAIYYESTLSKLFFQPPLPDIKPPSLSFRFLSEPLRSAIM